MLNDIYNRISQSSLLGFVCYREGLLFLKLFFIYNPVQKCQVAPFWFPFWSSDVENSLSKFLKGFQSFLWTITAFLFSPILIPDHFQKFLKQFLLFIFIYLFIFRME